MAQSILAPKALESLKVPNKRPTGFFLVKKTSSGEFKLEAIDSKKQKTNSSGASVSSVSNNNNQTTQSTSTSTTSSVQFNKNAPVIVKHNPPCSGIEIFRLVQPLVLQGVNAVKSATPRTQDKLLLLFTNNQQDRDEIIRRLVNKSEFILEEPTKKNPKILVLGVLVKESSLKEIESNLRNDNGWQQKRFKILKLTKPRTTKEGKTINIVIDVEPNIRQTLEDGTGKVVYEGNAYPFKDVFSIKQCSNCHRLGHTSSQCRSPISCRYCGKKKHQECPSKEDKSKQHCVSCKRMGHYSTDPNCPKLKAKLQAARTNVNFGYKKIY